MRIISPKKLRDFFSQNKYQDSEKELNIWMNIIKRKDFKNSHEVKEVFPDADPVGNNRIVFNIKRNKYRLIALFRYAAKAVYIRFIGTHKDYDKIDNAKNI